MANKLDIVPLSEWGMFTEPRPSVIAGPCSAESEEQVMDTARRLRAFGINVFRAGIWKPRTHPGSFEGVGTEGLKWMQRAKRELGLKISTEVASQRHVLECLKYGVDVVWLGARTTANPFLVQEIAEALSGADIPVLVKNPVNADIGLWLGALERLNGVGLRKLGVIHRGFSSITETKYRNDAGWQVALELRSREPSLPFFCDPSHLGGSRDYLLELSQRSMDLGLDGLMIESHCSPDSALSDAKQQIVPEDLKVLLESLVIRQADSDNASYKENIDQLRSQIDVIDENLISLLASRMALSRRIGECKRDSNIAIVQASRWDSVLAGVVRLAAEKGLSPDFVIAVFNAIHSASVAVQNEVLNIN
ncbi:MAG: bifunctional 3-deoxy-7-phosphoheptulonate synthase/chorismate mutase type II [Bacteroidales bacterium]|nr:bifunctional 3-deoxy-7-phosphoheptulonate synthase/chorismate mutase type II [Bacteroidales bacterium]